MLCVAACFSACSDDDKGPAPTNIDGQTLTYDKRPGGLVIRWTIPENPTYKYIRVTYQVPGESTQRMRLASVYSDSILIDNLLARYGDIVYQLQPVSSGVLQEIRSASRHKRVRQRRLFSKPIRTASISIFTTCGPMMPKQAKDHSRHSSMVTRTISST